MPEVKEEEEEEKKGEEPELLAEFTEPEPQEETVELDEEEKKQNHVKKTHSFDLETRTLNAGFSKFSIPEKTEGFDAIEYKWDKEAKAAEYLKAWLLDKKLTTRMEDLQPGATFREKKVEFTKFLKTCQEKVASWKRGGSKKLTT